MIMCTLHVQTKASTSAMQPPTKKNIRFLGLRFRRSAAFRLQRSAARLQRIASTLRGSDRALALKMRFSQEVFHIG